MRTGSTSTTGAGPSRANGDVHGGYLCLREDGAVLAFGAAHVPHQAAGSLRGPASALAVSASGGYWVVTRRGQVVGCGLTDIVGPEGIPANVDVVDLVATSTDRGLWALDTSGGVFCFGAASFHGSIPGLGLDLGVGAVALTPTPGDRGYWVLDRSGGVFCFGNARFFGSLHDLGVPRAPAVALLPGPDGDGYNIITEDGSVRPFGRAAELRSVRARNRIVAVTGTGDGALLLDAKGIVYPLGAAPFLGTPLADPLTRSMIDVAWYPASLSE